jgi:hypothetical protein
MHAKSIRISNIQFERKAVNLEVVGSMILSPTQITAGITISTMYVKYRAQAITTSVRRSYACVLKKQVESVQKSWYVEATQRVLSSCRVLSGNHRQCSFVLFVTYSGN